MRTVIRRQFNPEAVHQTTAVRSSAAPENAAAAQERATSTHHAVSSWMYVSHTETCLVTAYVRLPLRVSVAAATTEDGLRGDAADDGSGVVWELLWMTDSIAADSSAIRRSHTTPSKTPQGGANSRSVTTPLMARGQFVFVEARPEGLWPWYAEAAEWARDHAVPTDTASSPCGLLFVDARTVAIHTRHRRRDGRPVTKPVADLALDLFTLHEDHRASYTWVRHERGLRLREALHESELLAVGSVPALHQCDPTRVTFVYITMEAVGAGSGQLVVSSAVVQQPTGPSDRLTATPWQTARLELDGLSDWDAVASWQWLMVPIPAAEDPAHLPISVWAVLPTTGRNAQSAAAPLICCCGVTEEAEADVRIGLVVPQSMEDDDNDEEDWSCLEDPEEIIQRFTTDRVVLYSVPVGARGEARQRVENLDVFTQSPSTTPVALQVVTDFLMGPHPMRSAAPGLYASPVMWADVLGGASAQASAAVHIRRVPRARTAWLGSQPLVLTENSSPFSVVPTTTTTSPMGDETLPAACFLLQDGLSGSWQIASVWRPTAAPPLFLAVPPPDSSADGHTAIEQLLLTHLPPLSEDGEATTPSGAAPPSVPSVHKTAATVAQELLSGLLSHLHSQLDASGQALYQAVRQATQDSQRDEPFHGGKAEYTVRIREVALSRVFPQGTAADAAVKTVKHVVHASRSSFLTLLRQLTWHTTTAVALAVERITGAVFLGAALPPRARRPDGVEAAAASVDAEVRCLQVLLAGSGCAATAEDNFFSMALLLYINRRHEEPLELLMDDLLHVDAGMRTEVLAALWQVVDESLLLDTLHALSHTGGSGGLLDPPEIDALLEGTWKLYRLMAGSRVSAVMSLVPLLTAVSAALFESDPGGDAGTCRTAQDITHAVDHALATFHEVAGPEARLALPMCLQHGPTWLGLATYPWCAMPPLAVLYLWRRVVEVCEDQAVCTSADPSQTGEVTPAVPKALKEGVHVIWWLSHGQTQVAADLLGAMHHVAQQPPDPPTATGSAHGPRMGPMSVAPLLSSYPPGGSHPAFLMLSTFGAVLYTTVLRGSASPMAVHETMCGVSPLSNATEYTTWCVARVLHLCFASAAGKLLQWLASTMVELSAPRTAAAREHPQSAAMPTLDASTTTLVQLYVSAAQSSPDPLTRSVVQPETNSTTGSPIPTTPQKHAALMYRLALNVWYYAHTRDPEAPTNAILCEKLCEAFLVLQHHPKVKRTHDDGAANVASVLMDLVRVYFVWDYPLLRQLVRRHYEQQRSSPLCVQFDTWEWHTSGSSGAASAAHPAMLVVDEVCEAVQRGLMRVLSTAADESPPVRCLVELLRRIPTVAEETDALSQSFEVSPATAYFVASHSGCHQRETGRFVVGAAMIRKDLSPFVCRRVDEHVVSRAGTRSGQSPDEGRLRGEGTSSPSGVAQMLNELAEDLEGCSRALATCLPLYEPTVLLLMLDIASELLHEAVAQGRYDANALQQEEHPVILKAALNTLDSLEREEQRQCLLTVRTTFCKALPCAYVALLPNIREESAKGLPASYGDSPVHQRIVHRTLPSVLAQANEMQRGQKEEKQRGTKLRPPRPPRDQRDNRTSFIPDRMLDSVGGITSSVLGALGVPSSPALHLRPTAVSEPTRSEDSAVVLLVKEEVYRRQQLSAGLLTAYKSWSTSEALEGALAGLYIAMRHERRRRELMHFAVEQHDIVFTFGARLLALAAEWRREESHRLLDAVERRDHLQRETLCGHEEEARVELTTACAMERRALWAAAVNLEEILLDEEGGRTTWQHIESEDWEELLGAWGQGSADAQEAAADREDEEEWRRLPRTTGASGDDPASGQAERRAARGQHSPHHCPNVTAPPPPADLTDTACTTGFSTVVEAGDGLLGAFHRLHNRIRDTVAPPARPPGVPAASHLPSEETDDWHWVAEDVPTAPPRVVQAPPAAAPKDWAVGGGWSDEEDGQLPALKAAVGHAQRSSLNAMVADTAETTSEWGQGGWSDSDWDLPAVPTTAVAQTGRTITPAGVKQGLRAARLTKDTPRLNNSEAVPPPPYGEKGATSVADENWGWSDDEHEVPVAPTPPTLSTDKNEAHVPPGLPPTAEWCEAAGWADDVGPTTQPTAPAGTVSEWTIIWGATDRPPPARLNPADDAAGTTRARASAQPPKELPQPPAAPTVSSTWDDGDDADGRGQASPTPRAAATAAGQGPATAPPQVQASVPHRRNRLRAVRVDGPPMPERVTDDSTAPPPHPQDGSVVAAATAAGKRPKKRVGGLAGVPQTPSQVDDGHPSPLHGSAVTSTLPPHTAEDPDRTKDAVLPPEASPQLRASPAQALDAEVALQRSETAVDEVAARALLTRQRLLHYL